MQKIAVFLITMFFFPIAWANISLSGHFNTSVEITHSQITGTNYCTNSNSSKFNIKEEENLYNFIVGFLIENSFDSTGNSEGKLNSGDIYINFRGKFGEIRAGRIKTPLAKSFTSMIEILNGDGIQSPTKSLSGIADLGTRFSSSISYISPSISHQMKAAIQVSDAQNGSLPGHLPHSYKVSRVVDSSLLFNSDNSNACWIGALSTRIGWTTILNQSYRDYLTLAILKYAPPTSHFSVTGAFENDNYHSTDTSIHKLFLSVQYTIKQTTLLGLLGHANNQTKAGITKANTAALQWTLGTQYNLSRRTLLYSYITQLINDSASPYFLSTTTSGGPIGINTRAFVFGIQHDF